MRSRFIASITAVALFAAVTLIAAGANASWLWIVEINDSDQTPCAEGFTLVSIETNGSEIIACLPEGTQTAKHENSGEHDGPLEGPHFN
jgi:FlaG/FlaF family flagellin (archaellin)